MENKEKKRRKKDKQKNQISFIEENTQFENKKLYKFFTLFFLLIPISIAFFTLKENYKKKEKQQLAKQTMIIKINYENQKLEQQLKIRKKQLKILKKKNQNTEKNLSFQEAKNFCESIGSRLPKIKELKRFFEKRKNSENLDGIQRIWSSSLNKKKNYYIYDINKKTDLVEDRKNIKYGVFCFE